MEGNLYRSNSDGQYSVSSRGDISGAITELQTEFQASSLCDDSLEKIFVAVSKEFKESKSVLMWALQNSPRSKKFVLVHVHCPDKMIPMPLGGKFPASQLSEQELAVYRHREKQKMYKNLRQYLDICARAKVEAETLVIEMDDIAKGLLALIRDHCIPNLVMGAASDGKYSKNMKFSRKAKHVREKAASCCRISFVCKGKFICFREEDICYSRSSSTPESVNSTWSQESQLPVSEEVIPLVLGSEDTGPREIPIINPREELPTDSLSVQRSTEMEVGSQNSSSLVNEEVDSLGSRSEDLCRREVLINIPQNEGLGMHSVSMLRPTLIDVSSRESLSSAYEQVNVRRSRLKDEHSQEIPITILQDEELRADPVSLPRTSEMDLNSGNSSFSSIYEVVNAPPSPLMHNLEVFPESFYPLDAQEDIIIQLHQALEEARSAKKEVNEEFCKRMKAEKDALNANQNVRMLTIMHERETKQRTMAVERLAREIKGVEKLRAENLDSLQKLREAQEQRSALEARLAQLEKELSEAQLLISSPHEATQELSSSISSPVDTPGFSVFTYEELDRATRGFDSSLKIGEGGYGTVYKGTLRHTTVAIKRLHSHEDQSHQGFWQEVDVLRRVRHPNLVMLIGVCPEAWCLVYEYLPNGSLEDHLTCKDKFTPLSWQSRLSIMIDICSALIFLHSTEPHGIVHGDLKPANVLLDSGFVSKLGDFGLSRLLSHVSSSSSQSSFLCHYTDAPRGTFAYMDPEILVTGELTVGSDVYSLGVIILRLLTARPAQRIARDVEEALENNNFHRMLDQSAGNWPFIQAKQLAQLALQCCAMTHKARPNLTTGVYRILEPMFNSAFATPSPVRLHPSRGSKDDDYHVPSYFLCPIFQEVMRDPQVAADGYTYEREAVRGWFEIGNHTSPMTNLVLPHQQLIPNHALRSAIQEWLQQYDN